ncbi:hypothetical protein [Sphingopyxis sp. NFH-91]|nr:hypothetical protein [Sphingopyxis sp. NFH-91]
MAAYFRLEVPRRSDRNGGKKAEVDRSALLLHGARLWCDEHPLEVGGDGYLIGHLFERGATSRVLDLCEAAAEKILASGGRSLATDY